MKNQFAIILPCALLVAVVLGCSAINPFSDKAASNTASNKSLTDKAVDKTVGEEKIGIPECDEVMDLLTAEANNPDDNFVIKAAKGVFINKIKETIRRSIEENKTDKARMAKDCKQAKAELEKYKAEEANKKAN